MRKRRTTELLLREMYDALVVRFGHRGWWPGDSPFEVCVGAILTQNTAWKNVAKAIGNLKASDDLDPFLLHAMSHERLAELIRPAGYYNVKAKRLRNLLNLIVEEYEGSPEAVVKALRDALAADLPSSAPPPYERAHTTLHIHCLLAKTIGDPALLPELESLAGSDNEYVRGKAEAAADWLRQEVRYPIRYHELKRAFSSQS